MTVNMEILMSLNADCYMDSVTYEFDFFKMVHCCCSSLNDMLSVLC